MEKYSIETFRNPAWYLRDLSGDNTPSCFNGNVSVIKYRITVEVIEEPEKEIHRRLQYLWDKATNMHHRQPLNAEAKKHGYVFIGDMGNSAR